MGVYIWGTKNGVNLIDLSKTDYQLRKAADFLKGVVSKGLPILWVGTKRAAQQIIDRISKETDMPAVTHRWIGGTITNSAQVKKSITKLLHYEDVLNKASEHAYTKKEFGVIQKNVDRLERNVGGIRGVTWPIGAIVVVDIRKEHVAVKEAAAAGIPVVALVDTNCDPSLVTHVIPGNDDAPRAIEAILNDLASAVQAGITVAAERPKEELVQDGGVEQLLAQVERVEEDDGKSKRRPIKSAGPQRQPSRPTRPVARPAARRPRSNEGDQGKPSKE
jgi:small subunit ribosomal protein S2